MFEKVKYYWHVATDKYFINMAYVEKVNGTPTTIEKKFIVYNDKDGSMDYTEDPKQATCFGFILGTLVCNKLRSESKDLPNLQFFLVSVNDAMFIDTIFSGSSVPYESKKEAIDFAAEELTKLYAGKEGIAGIGVHKIIDAEKKIKNSFIEIHVTSEKWMKEAEKEFSHIENGITALKYKEFPVKVMIYKVNQV